MMGNVLYGPPASGKSTATVALRELDPRFTLVRKLKTGNRRGTEYDFVSAAELATLRDAGRLLVQSHRYGNTYAIDRHQIDQLTSTGRVPIVHLGNIADIQRLVQAAPWLTVLLWVPAGSSRSEQYHLVSVLDQSGSAATESARPARTSTHSRGCPHDLPT